MSKRETNTEMLSRVMEINPHGSVMQGFILQGLEQWCDNVIAASDQIPEGGFISKAAWLGCATHLKEQFVERRK